MTCTPTYSSSPVSERAERTEPVTRGVVRLTLNAGGHASVDVGGDRVAIDVRRGSVWLTEDATDHVLAAGATFACAAGRRVVVTALSGATIDVRREPRR